MTKRNRLSSSDTHPTFNLKAPLKSHGNESGEQRCFIRLACFPISLCFPLNLRTHRLSSEDYLASGGNSQCFGGSSVASGYLDNGYPGQRFLFHALDVVYSLISNLTFTLNNNLTFWLISSRSRYLHVKMHF